VAGPGTPKSVSAWFMERTLTPRCLGTHIFGDVVTYGLLRAIGAMAPVKNSSSSSNAGHAIGQSSHFISPLMGVQQPSQQQHGLPPGVVCGPQEPPIRFHKQALNPKYCSEPGSTGGAGTAGSTTFMTTQNPASFQPVANTGCWRWFEDRPGRPGV
jgi:hypothetical protein